MAIVKKEIPEQKSIDKEEPVKSEFETRDAAVRFLNSFLPYFRETQEKKFCPLTKDRCWPSCVCFCEPSIEANSTGTAWIIKNAYCGNRMFRGE